MLLHFFWILLVAAVGFFAYRCHVKNGAYEKKFSGIIDIEGTLAEKISEKKTIEESISELQKGYKEKKAIFDDLVKHAAVYDERIELAELGFYSPHYDFDTSERFKEELDKVKAKQKEMLSRKSAIICGTAWLVHGSAAKGETMASRGIKLTARAFNNECDAAIANTRWNNAARIEQRIVKAFESINAMNKSLNIEITKDYLDLKLAEFRLTHEQQEKKQREKEEQAAIRQQMREEAKLEQEVQAAIKEEERYQQLLEKAKKDADKTTGPKLAELEQKIAALNADLARAHEKSERAKSMAQQTKAGHIYVISNVGAFGENIYKIGMTRRLEPDERVKELGDASVPFSFDVHAMIFSEDAPSLETSLHKAFDAHRLNLVNNRKEFFKVDLEHIEKAVKENFPASVFVVTPEAREYRESEAIRAQLVAARSNTDVLKAFPLEI